MLITALSVVFLSTLLLSKSIVAAKNESSGGILDLFIGSASHHHWLKKCPAPSVVVCDAHSTVTESFYGQLTTSFTYVSELWQKFTSISMKMTGLFHYYECYLAEFEEAQKKLTTSIKYFETEFMNKFTAYNVACTVVNYKIPLYKIWLTFICFF